MRIVSLLPSATEIVYALGLDDELAAVTDSCDFPADARSKPVVSSAIVDSTEMPPAEVDRIVSEKAAAGESMYSLDAEAIGRIQPDLILTQDLCQVCAVPSGQVDAALDRLGCRAEVVSLDPSSLHDVLEDIVRLGRATDRDGAAAELVAELRARIEAVRAAVVAREKVPAMALEWLDPPFTAGHWVPDMIDLAGGVSLLAEPGATSRRATWDEVAAADPAVIVAMPCGYGLERARHEASRLYEVAEIAATRAIGRERVFAGDAGGRFSRPGPRLIDGIEALAWALHPDAVAQPSEGIVAPVGRLT
jgi:iron complex transport system substrate-binding protein